MIRRCARPGCGSEAATTLSYAYAERVVWLDDLHENAHPANYDLCGFHARRTRPPKGWELRDRRGPAVGVRLRKVS